MFLVNFFSYCWIQIVQKASHSKYNMQPGFQSSQKVGGKQKQRPRKVFEF